MISAQTIRKLSFFIAAASFVFTIIAALMQFMLLDLTTLGAPASYYLLGVDFGYTLSVHWGFGVAGFGYVARRGTRPRRGASALAGSIPINSLKILIF
jgi:hypothetical protein